MSKLNSRRIIENIKVSDIEGFMLNTWTDYFFSSDLGLRLEINLKGHLRLSKDRSVIWQGTDISEAILRLTEES